jgi:hypothetical protein
MRHSLPLLVAAVPLLLLLGPAPAQQAGPTFRPRVLAEGQVMNSVIAADLNGDGRPDLASAGPEEIAWFERGKDGWTRRLVRKQSAESGSLDTIWLQAHDLDSDRDLDLIAATPNAAGNLAWYENPGAAAAEWPRHLIDRLPKVHGQALEDLNSDGRLDIVANTEGKLVWYSVPANVRELRAAGTAGDFPQWERRILTQDGAGGTPHYLRFAALTNGKPNVLLAASPDTSYLAWWERPASGSGDWSRRVVREPFPDASHLIPADIDRDGVTDLFYNRGHSAGSGWLAGPDFTQDHPVDEGSLKEPHALAVGDLNGDGAADAAACARTNGGLVLWLNDGKGRFTSRSLDPAPRAMDLKIVDADGDGDQDLLLAGATAKNVVLYENMAR